MPDQTVGALVLARDEADLLPQCLQSLRDADEIVVADTGSTDSTAQLAQTFGAKVLRCEWNDDFSAARNEAIKHIGTDWILIVDADECLVTGWPSIRTLLAESGAEAYAALVENIIGSRPEDRLMHRAVRLFRARRGYTFRGRVHESVEQSVIERCGPEAVADADIILRHYGYLPQLLQRKDKIARNERLLKLELGQNPGDPFCCYNMGVACTQAGRLQEARHWLGKALENAPDGASYRLSAVRCLARVLLETGKAAEAQQLLQRELAVYALDAELHYRLGQALEARGLPERAVYAYRQAAECNDEGSLVYEPGMNSYRPLTAIAALTLRSGRPQEAAQLFQAALRRHSRYAPALEGIADAFARLNAPANEIASLLAKTAAPEESAHYALIASALHGVGLFESVIDFIPPALLSDPEQLKLCAASLMLAGRPMEANDALSRYIWPERGDAPDELVRLWALCQWSVFGALQDNWRTLADSGRFEPLRRLDGRLRRRDGEEAAAVENKAQDAEHTTGNGRNGAVESSLSGAGADGYGFSSAEGCCGTAGDTDGVDCGLSDCTRQLVREAAGIRQPELAAKLADAGRLPKQQLAGLLYEAGCTYSAADLLLQLLEEGLLEAEGFLMLGELTYDRGSYLEAAGLFEEAALMKPELERASAGAASCYLLLAEASLLQAIQLAPDARQLRQELQQIRESERLLRDSGWHTEWRGAGRRIRDEQPEHLAMHDRQG